MTHIALYRKYRPSGFEHLVGQEHIKKTLLNAINGDSISHAYVFSGPRGTGKTSSAKLFAKAVSCQKTSHGEPCGTCDICSDSNPDIIEIDAASNNGVEEIRELRDKIGYTPVYGKYKVYIIDEVHMLTTGAFNALLKTLEEPPKHAMFILATTEPHKIPLTILSRCQRFDFRRITDKVIIERMSYIVEKEKVNVDKEALAIIARIANGGMRDALSLLDQAISHADGSVTVQDIVELTGTVDHSIIGNMIEAIEGKDTSQVLNLLDQIIETGKEPKFFLDDLLAYYRDILVYRRVGEKANLTKAFTDQSFKQLAEGVTIESTYTIIEILSKCQSQIKYAGQDKIILEVALIKATADNNVSELEALRKEIEALKQKVEQTPLTMLPAEELKPAKKDEPKVDNSVRNNVDKDKELDDFCRKMDGIYEPDKVLSNSDTGEFVESNMVIEPKEGSELTIQGEEININTAEQETFDLLSMIETELNSSEAASTSEKEGEDVPAEQTNVNFFDQLEKDITEGADYIQIVDSPSEEETVLTEEYSEARSNHLNEVQNKVFTILKSAKKEYRETYAKLRDDILSTLKAERVQVMALFRDAEVRAISSDFMVVTMNTKPQVKLLEKVINRSVVQGVLEEVMGMALKLVVLEKDDWFTVVQEFQKTRTV